MKNDIKVQLPEVTGNVAELVIREGNAAPIIMPTPYEFQGLLSAPGIFYKSRQESDRTYFNKSKAVVEVDFDKQTIIFDADTTDPNADRIIGTLFAESRLKPFRLNESYVWKPLDLAVFIRKNRMYFAEQDIASKLISELSTLKISTKGEIEVSNDDRGNKKNLLSQQTNTTIPVSFILFMPIISGADKRRFKVDIYLDVQGGSVSVALESVDLIEMTANDVAAAMQEQIEIFKDSGFPILYK